MIVMYFKVMVFFFVLIDLDFFFVFNEESKVNVLLF